MDESKFETRNSKFATAPAQQVRDFTDLAVWQAARELRRRVFELSSRFPTQERYILYSQIRRAAVSVTANIAEGFGRFSYQENVQFCRQARCSAFEVRDHLITALDSGLTPEPDWQDLDALAQRVIQLLNGYIRSTRLRQANPPKR